MYRLAVAQLDRAAEAIHLDENIWSRLRTPQRAHVVSFPFWRDEYDHIETVFGYRVQHLLTMGPTKGGIRYDPGVDLGELTALSMWMSWKCSLMNLPFGGAKGGLRINPRNFSARELQRITRRYTSEIIDVIGPDRDIPAPDLGTNELVMAWMMDTYSQQKGHAVPGVVTGKPVEIGGSLGRREATGRGVIACMLEACRHLEIDRARVAIQGFGNVGAATAQIAHELGCRVVAVSDFDGGIHCDAGLDVPSVIAHVKENRDLKSFPGTDFVTNEEILELPCDVLVPAAVENQISGANADRLRCRLLVEAANGPTDLEADAILNERGVHVVPDILANAGGVTVSYFEWIQSSQQLFWTEEQVNARLIALMQQVYRRVHEASEARGLDMRGAALQLGIERIATAKRTRGIFP
jgi:glutamate dehydrogenase (NAD(P)+)